MGGCVGNDSGTQVCEWEISYRVQIRLKGRSVQTATFERKTYAKKWVGETEFAIRDGRYFKTNA